MGIKPNELFIGLVDFFAILVPGAILSFTFPKYIYANIAPDIICQPPPGSAGIWSAKEWAIFFLVSYVIGHFIHFFGAVTLNPLYERTFYKRKIEKYGSFWATTEDLIKNLIPDHKSTIRVADAFIRTENPMLASELDRHEAASKLFRGLTLLLMALSIKSLIEVRGLARIIYLLLAFLSFWRFSNQRWKRNLLTYELFSILINRSQKVRLEAK